MEDQAQSLSEGLAWEIVDFLGQGVAILEADGHLTYVNAALVQMVGASAQALMAQESPGFTHPDDREKVTKAIQKAFLGERTTTDIRLEKPDGGLVFAQVTAVPRLESDSIVGAYLIVTDLTSAKKTEEALRRSEARYRRIVEDQTEFIVRWLPDGTRTFVNDAYCQHFDTTKEEMIGSSFFPLIHEADLAAVKARLAALTPENPVSTDEHRSLLPDGSVRWHRWIDRAFFDKKGRITELQSVGRDITEHKMAEEALKRSESNLNAILNNTLQSFFLLDRDGRIQALNSTARTQAKRILGRYLEPGQVFMDVISPIDPLDFPASFAAALQGHTKTTEARFTAPNGDSYWFEASYYPVTTDNGVIGVSLSVLNITERKMAEEALRRSKTELKHIIDSVPEGVLLLSNDGSILKTNPVADTFLAILAPDLTDGRLQQLGERPLSEILTSPPKGLWHEIIYKEHIFEAIARSIENSGNDTSWVLVLRDVTKEREIRQHVQRQERLAAVGQLAAGIAHDFNNIMAVIILYTQLLSRTIEMPPKAQERLNTIENQAQRATDLIQQILDFSRQSLMEQQPLDMLPFMKEVVKLLKRTLPENIQIELLYSDESYLIQADPSRIQQLLMNLAFNARDAMPNGGKLTISLANLMLESSTRLLITEMPQGSWVQIQVTDEGSGISPETTPRIFEPFFTTKEVGQGTGLGLAQVYGIVQQHEGFIDVTTRVGEGTTFTLYFPVLGDGEGEVVRLRNATLQHGRGQTVLLVEDNKATRKALVDSLQLLNYVVLEATNGREALDILATKRNEISLVLSDAVMPEMGGIALFHTMRQRQLKIPVILLTGHPFKKELESLKEVGLAAWMTKPPELAALSQLLFQTLAQTSPGDNEQTLS